MALDLNLRKQWITVKHFIKNTVRKEARNRLFNNVGFGQFLCAFSNVPL